MQPDFEAAERRALELDGRVADDVRAPEAGAVPDPEISHSASASAIIEEKVAQHKIAGTVGAITGAVTGTVVAGPPGTVVGAATGAARGVIVGEVFDRVKEHLHDVETALDPDPVVDARAGDQPGGSSTASSGVVAGPSSTSPASANLEP